LLLLLLLFLLLLSLLLVCFVHILSITRCCGAVKKQNEAFFCHFALFFLLTPRICILCTFYNQISILNKLYNCIAIIDSDCEYVKYVQHPQKAAAATATAAAAMQKYAIHKSSSMY